MMHQGRVIGRSELVEHLYDQDFDRDSNTIEVFVGRLLDAGLEPGPDGRPAYRVRWAAQGGQRIDFIVDAATGAILRRNGY